MGNDEPVPSEAEANLPARSETVVVSPSLPEPRWKLFFLLFGSCLLSMACFAFSQYLQTRGIVSVDLARGFLVVCWAALSRAHCHRGVMAFGDGVLNAVESW